MKVVIDAGHGGVDFGGSSRGLPEKKIALDYAIELGRRVRERGHQVTLTRVVDQQVDLDVRADIANRIGADLFVSLHCNSSDDANARGPWTIYAAVSPEGRRIAEVIHAAVHSVMGGSEDAVFPDASPWVDNRRLAVLRQTRMPAVMLELGFLTNPVEAKVLESPLTRSELCRKVALAIDQALGTRPVPEVVEPALVAERVPPNLQRIILPSREHFREAAKQRRLDPEQVMDYVELVEAILRVMVNSGVKRIKPAADVLAEVVKEVG